MISLRFLDVAVSNTKIFQHYILQLFRLNENLLSTSLRIYLRLDELFKPFTDIVKTPVVEDKDI